MKYTVYADGKKVSGEIALDELISDEVGIFETLRVYQGHVFCEEEHLRRFRESLKTTGYRNLPRLDSIQNTLKQAVRDLGPQDAILRLTLFRDQFFVMVGTRKMARALYRKGVRLGTSPVRRSLNHAEPPGIKTAAFQNAILAGLEPSSRKIYEWLLLDRQGHVCETRVGNIFMVDRKSNGNVPRLLTPPTGSILNGITRCFVIKCASQLGIPVREQVLSRHDLYNACEVFLTNTSWEILPVCELDGRPIGSVVPGRMTLKLHREFRRKVNEQCQSNP